MNLKILFQRFHMQNEETKIMDFGDWLKFKPKFESENNMA